MKKKSKMVNQTKNNKTIGMYELSHLPDDVVSALIKKRRPEGRKWTYRTDPNAPSIIRIGHPLVNALRYMLDLYEDKGCSDEESLLAGASVLLDFASSFSKNEKRKMYREYKISCEEQDNPFHINRSRRVKKV